MGFLRYAIRFLLGGLILGLVVLSFVNPGIWRQLQASELSRSFMPMASLIGAFGLLPALSMAIVLWRRNQRRFMQLTTGQNRHLPFAARAWKPSERIWGKSISIVTALVAVSAVLSLGLLLGHNAPDYFGYPFKASLLYLTAYGAYEGFMPWWAGKGDGELAVPALFKVALGLCLAAVVLAWGIFFVYH